MELGSSRLSVPVRTAAVLARRTVAALMVRSSGVSLSVSTAFECGLNAVTALAVGAFCNGDPVGAAAELVGVARTTFELRS